ncbi:MAG TPA: dehydratase, partial [Mycolicibacillus parakoreensis]|nr:dehydratase [Mycolicibacillus parakoreensis]
SAAAVLANVEARLPDAVSYSVRFGKPILLPATVGLYTERTADGWALSLRHLTKGYPHLTATVAAGL